jgi:hypothetical protein
MKPETEGSFKKELEPNRTDIIIIIGIKINHLLTNLVVT